MSPQGSLKLIKELGQLSYWPVILTLKCFLQKSKDFDKINLYKFLQNSYIFSPFQGFLVSERSLPPCQRPVKHALVISNNWNVTIKITSHHKWDEYKAKHNTQKCSLYVFSILFNHYMSQFSPYNVFRSVCECLQLFHIFFF